MIINFGEFTTQRIEAAVLYSIHESVETASGLVRPNGGRMDANAIRKIAENLLLVTQIVDQNAFILLRRTEILTDRDKRKKPHA